MKMSILINFDINAGIEGIMPNRKNDLNIILYEP